jgi:serralysin
VLGRSDGADAEGLAYWTGELASGRASNGSLVSTILNSAHTFKGDATYGWVANLLDNKLAVAKTFAIDWGLNNNTPAESISQGMAIAAAVTPTGTAAAIALIGVTASELQLG